MKKTQIGFALFMVVLLTSSVACFIYIVNRNNDNENDEFEIQIQRLIEKYENTPIVISNFEFKNAKLIFSFSEECCDLCVTELFELLNDTQLFSPSDIVILTAYQEERKLNVFLKYHKIRNHTVNLKEKRSLPFNELSLPYFFIYDPQKKKIQSFFIPRKDNKQLTLKYLESIKSKMAIN